MDRIIIRGLRVKTCVGAAAEERAAAQHVLIDVEASCDLSVAGTSDALPDTVDYSALVAAITETAEASDVALLERLAQEIADVARRHPRVTAVTVTIEKVKPPLTQDVSTVAVSIER